MYSENMFKEEDPEMHFESEESYEEVRQKDPSFGGSQENYQNLENEEVYLFGRRQGSGKGEDKVMNVELKEMTHAMIPQNEDEM